MKKRFLKILNLIVIALLLFIYNICVLIVGASSALVTFVPSFAIKDAPELVLHQWKITTLGLSLGLVFLTAIFWCSVLVGDKLLDKLFPPKKKPAPTETPSEAVP